MKNIFFILLFTTAAFSDTYFTFFGASYHFDRHYYVEKKTVRAETTRIGELDIIKFKPVIEKEKKYFNEDNRAIGIYHTFKNNYSTSMTRFINSYYEECYVLSAHYDFIVKEDISFSITAGKIYGYEKYDSRHIESIVYPSIKLNFSKLQLELSITPDMVFSQARFKIF